MKKLVSILALVLIVACLTACGGRIITPNTVQIHNSDGTNSVSYETYMDEESAKANPITYYAEQSDFPISIIIYCGVGDVNKFKCTTYGVQKPYDYYTEDASAYAYIMIEPYTEEIETEIESETQTTEEEVIDSAETAVEETSSTGTGESLVTTVSDNDLTKKTKATESKNTASSNSFTKEQLLDLLEEPTTESLRDPESIYRQEIDQLSAGTWDGSMRKDYIEYNGTTYEICHDAAVGRTYFWKKYNTDTGEEIATILPIDYDGPLETREGLRSSNEYYSLVIDYDHNIIEQWSLFEKQDSWQLEFANNGEQIDYVLVHLDAKCRGKIGTVDEDGHSHGYNLLVGGVVERKY